MNADRPAPPKALPTPRTADADRIDQLRIERGDDAFSGLSHEQRLRLIVQVLCALVAYDAPDEPTVSARPASPRHDALTDRLAS